MSRNGGQRKEFPVGTIRVRTHHVNGQYKVIKVCADGPPGDRWVSYAIYRYTQAYGSVPGGKVIIHIDGNRLNSDIGNLRAVSRGDSLYIATRRTTKPPEEGIRLRSEKARERLIARRILGEIQVEPWYLVDHQERRITGPYGRRMWMALRVAGVDGATGRTCARSGWVRCLLGWPHLQPIQALTLAALAQSEEPLRIADITSGISTIAHLCGFDPDYRGKYRLAASALIPLEQGGYVQRDGRPSTKALYRPTGKAIQERKTPNLLAPMRGRDAMQYINQGYRFIPVIPEKCDKTTP